MKTKNIVGGTFFAWNDLNLSGVFLKGFTSNFELTFTNNFRKVKHPNATYVPTRVTYEKVLRLRFKGSQT